MNGGGNVAAIFFQTAVIQIFQHTQFIAAGQVQLEGLGQVGNLALLLGQGDGQAQKVA